MQAVRVIKQYPLGRLIVFAYLVLMHALIYILLHRLQHKAFRDAEALSVAALHAAATGEGDAAGGQMGGTYPHEQIGT
jgi:hypothetical protein